MISRSMKLCKFHWQTTIWVNKFTWAYDTKNMLAELPSLPQTLYSRGGQLMAATQPSLIQPQHIYLNNITTLHRTNTLLSVQCVSICRVVLWWCSNYKCVLTLKVPEELQLYGLYVYYVVHICDFGMLRVKGWVEVGQSLTGQELYPLSM